MPHSYSNQNKMNYKVENPQKNLSNAETDEIIDIIWIR